MRPGRPSRVGWCLAVALLLAGCGSQPPQSPSTGVDELVIPTPSPDPSDFVAHVDNPWLPLVAGTRWTYTVSGLPGVQTRTSQVLPEPRTVAGVTTTVLRDTDLDGEGDVVETTDRYYAQDRAGNVWWLGDTDRSRGWQAGSGGAEAGLAMPAAPRLGDGFRTGYAAGVVDDVDTVVSVNASAPAPYDDVDGGLLLEQTSEISNLTTRLTYVPGVGLVQSADVAGGEERLLLSSLDAG